MQVQNGQGVIGKNLSNLVFPFENSTTRITINECFWKRITCTLAFLAADSAFTWAGVLREGVFVGLANSSASLWSAEADFVTGLLDFMSGCLAEIHIKTLKKVVLTLIQTHTRPEVFVISYLVDFLWGQQIKLASKNKCEKFGPKILIPC